MKEINQLLKITYSLRKQYGRSFTLDGKLVGDIGEILAKEKYGLVLLPENTPIHDAEEKATGRKVQIKSSFKGYSYFPYNEVPEYFLSLIIKLDGSTEELFNGPGQFIVDHYIKEHNLKPYKNSYYPLSKGILKDLNKKVAVEDKIKEI